MESIPVFKPLIGPKEIEASTKSLEMGWLGMGKSVGEFETALHNYLEVGDRHVVAVGTGHAALHLGLLIAGVGPGDEVITPSFNNIADFQAILATGASPVFCDICEDSLCIDLNKAAELVTDRTKAIIVMDYDCVLCDHDAVEKFSERHQVRVIHDAAHAFGSRYKGKMIGSFSDICMFSFDPVKTITCIDGGALVVKTEAEKVALHEMRLIGMGQPSETMYQNKRAWTYGVTRLGFRYHMANLHAAIGIAQIARMQEISKTRRDSCLSYNRALESCSGVRTPKTDFKDITPFLYYIRVDKDLRDDLRAFLSDNGVDTGIHWQPGHWFDLFKDCRKGNLDITEVVGREVLSLPLHSEMNSEDLLRVTRTIKQFFDSKK